MKVFLSWSGENSQSHQVAMVLHEWLPSVIQQVKPWLSSQDIKTGSQWQAELDKELTATRFGIFAITWESKDKPYLMFEAGALSKYVDENNFVCPYYFGLKPIDVKNPLSAYQGQESSKEGTLKLLKGINSAMGPEGQIETRRLEQVYDKWWPDLEIKLKEISESKTPKQEPEPRRPEDMLEEILNLTRGIANNLGKKVSSPREVMVSRERVTEVRNSRNGEINRTVVPAVYEVIEPDYDEKEKLMDELLHIADKLNSLEKTKKILAELDEPTDVVDRKISSFRVRYHQLGTIISDQGD